MHTMNCCATLVMTPDKTEFLVNSFKNGFLLGYQGPKVIQRYAPNLKLRVGNETVLWNKVMKEVRERRYAGPFKTPPFQNFIQSPIGLVPKDGGRDTRLIFHLSYPRNGNSVNSGTPQELCKVKYCEFDDAIRRCLEEGKGCKISRSDMKAAFRNLGMAKQFWPYLIMKAKNPDDGLWYYFVDKCLPFGASISCAHFQAFSNSIAHIVRYYTKRECINYLDDYLFAALIKAICDGQVKTFLDICKQINFPVSLEKTFWGTTRLTFLGLLIDTVLQCVCVPVEKIEKAKELISQIRYRRTVTIHQLQKLCGFLNFVCRAVPPGRAFTRRLYAYTGLSNGQAAQSNIKKLLPHHHVSVNKEMKSDLDVWSVFLSHPTVYSRPFTDFSKTVTSVDIDMFSDASKNFKLGFGGYCQDQYFSGTWDNFTRSVNPSIAYLELYAVTTAVLLWIHKFKNSKVCLFVDNKGARDMINGASSNCKNCMVLIRLITLEGLKHNVTIKAKYVESKKNGLADALSRGQQYRFWRLIKRKRKLMQKRPVDLPTDIWPLQKIWLK